MTDKVYAVLMEPRRLQAQIRGVQSEQEGLRLSMLPSGIRYDRDKVSTSVSDPMAAFAVRMDELDARMRELQEQYLEAQDRVVAAADRLMDARGEEGAEQATVVKLRFIAAHSFEEIAREMHVSERTMFRRYHDGLEALDAIL